MTFDAEPDEQSAVDVGERIGLFSGRGTGEDHPRTFRLHRSGDDAEAC